MNGPSEYADIVVFVPNVLILNVQCKYSAQNSSLPVYEWGYELGKMGCVDVTTKFGNS